VMTTYASVDNTNTQYLTDGNYAKLAPFVAASANVFKCPSDQFAPKGQTRVRSCSMNGAMGQGMDVGAGLPGMPKGESYWMDYSNDVNASYVKMSQIRGPTTKFVMLDEAAQSVNDGAIYVDTQAKQLLDLPGTYHNNGTDFNWADGHSEIHRWTDPTFYKDTAHNVTMTSPDLVWLAQHAWSGQ